LTMSSILVGCITANPVLFTLKNPCDIALLYSFTSSARDGVNAEWPVLAFGTLIRLTLLQYFSDTVLIPFNEARSLYFPLCDRLGSLTFL
jgi:hypothetical protein